MGVVHSPDSGFAKEMAKWNFYHSEFGPPGRQFVQKDYPARLYKAVRGSNGAIRFEGVTVGDEDERDRSERLGFVWGGQGEALKALEASELEIAKLAANLNYQAARMSPGAAADIGAAQAAAGARHLGEVPAAPVKRGRGRPKKAEVVAHVE